MLDQASQWIAAVLTIISTILLARKSKWGVVCSLAAQPFWIITTWNNNQFPLVVIAIIYTLIWLYGIPNWFRTSRVVDEKIANVVTLKKFLAILEPRLSEAELQRAVSIFLQYGVHLSGRVTEVLVLAHCRSRGAVEVTLVVLENLYRDHLAWYDLDERGIQWKREGVFGSPVKETFEGLYENTVMKKSSIPWEYACPPQLL